MRGRGYLKVRLLFVKHGTHTAIRFMLTNDLFLSSSPKQKQKI